VVQARIREHFLPYLPDAQRYVTLSALQVEHPPPPAESITFDFLLEGSRKAFTMTWYVHEHGLPGGTGWLER
jgi:hypothetical protein